MGKLLVLFISILSVSCSAGDAKDGGAPIDPPQEKTTATGLTCADIPEIKEEEGDKSKIDLDAIEKQLNNSGLGGWVHSAVKDEKMFVFTWRQPGNFFINMQFPMFSIDQAVHSKLAKLRRHDQIKLKGKFVKGQAPLQHIEVEEITIVEKYNGPEDYFEYDPTILNTIMEGSEVVAKVHVVANKGAVLVIEKGDRVLPVFNPEPDLAKCLYRNDKVRIQYKVRSFPNRPSHLELNVEKNQPLEIMERIVDAHGEEFEVSGPLVMFPQSPQIKFDVYAIRDLDPDNLQRNFTFMSEDFSVFFALKDKLEEVWKTMADSAQYDRNKFINNKIWIKAKGKKNVVDPTQANPQIFISDINDVEITIKP